MADPLTNDGKFNSEVAMIGKLTGEKWLPPEVIISTAKGDLEKVLENTRRARWNETAPPDQKAPKLQTAFTYKHLKDAPDVQSVLRRAVKDHVYGAVGGIRAKDKSRVLIYESLDALKAALKLAEERGI